MSRSDNSMWWWEHPIVSSLLSEEDVARLEVLCPSEDDLCNEQEPDVDTDVDVDDLEWPTIFP